MQITTNNQTIESSGLGQTSTFGIKNSAAAFQLLSSGLYTNKIRAVLREIGCNAVDAHVLNGKQAIPIDVKLPNALDTQFYVRDYGPGLSHDQIMHLYSTYFDSTKQASDNFIGGFGVGSKSPFAYTDSFTVVSRHNGLQQTYAAFVNDEGMPSIATMSDAVATEEPNGLQVGFPVKPSDFHSFRSEALEVYSAFKVEPNILGVTLDFESYKLTPLHEGLSYSNVDQGYSYKRSAISVNMGGVRYPMDSFLEKLSNTNAQLTPQAQWLYKHALVLDVPIGSVSVAASREALQFDKKTMAAMPQMLNEAAEKCLDFVKDTIEGFSADKPLRERAQMLKEVLTNSKYRVLQWNDIPNSVVSEKLHSAEHTLMFSMAMRERYLIDFTPFPALHVWMMNSETHKRLTNLKVKGFDFQSFAGRQRALTNLRRSWNAAVGLKDPSREVLVDFSTHSIGPLNQGDHAASLSGSVERAMHLMEAFDVAETTRVMALTSFIENFVYQPINDFYAGRKSYPKSHILSPVARFDDAGKPRALTGEELQEFETQKTAFYKLYGITPKQLPALQDVTAPVKSKTASQTVWTVPLESMDSVSMRKTLRGLPSSGVADMHDTVSAENVGYITYDRKSSQAMVVRGLNETDLSKQYNKFNAFIRYSKNLDENSIPTALHLVDKKDLTAFKALYPNAERFESALKNLREDPVFLAKVKHWSENRPFVLNLDHRAHSWIDIVENAQNLAEDSLLSRTVRSWQENKLQQGQMSNDNDLCNFYNLLLGTSYPNIYSNSIDAAINELNETYPYIRYMDYNAPMTIKIQHIEEVNQTKGWTQAPSVEPGGSLDV